MPSTPSITQIAQAANVGRADVIRLLTEGGTTETDWAIAREIEKAGGKKAAELMLTAGRDHMIATIWGDSGETPQPPAPTNPHAVHDPQVRIYGEDTSPESPNTITPYHPHEDPEPEPADDREAADDLAATVHADLAEVLNNGPAATRLTAAWLTPTEGRTILRRVLSLQPRTRWHAFARHGRDLLTTA